MSRICPDCKEGELNILGLSDTKNAIIVQCNSCEYVAEVGPNGLGEGGAEYVEAWRFTLQERERNKENERRQIESESTREILLHALAKAVYNDMTQTLVEMEAVVMDLAQHCAYSPEGLIRFNNLVALLIREARNTENNA